MRTLNALIVATLIFSVGAVADNPKEAVTRQSLAVDVPAIPDVGVKVAVRPSPTQQVRGFNLTVGGDAHTFTEFTVPNDSILKFVNISLKTIGPSSAPIPKTCDMTVTLRFPAANATTPLTLAELSASTAGPHSQWAPLTGPTSGQFLTGDLLVPAGSVLRLERFSLMQCYGRGYGILFEQD